MISAHLTMAESRGSSFRFVHIYDFQQFDQIGWWVWGEGE